MSRVVRVGSRDSSLAIKQADIVMRDIKKYHPDINFELVTIKTKGDKILDRSLDKIGGKGLFIKELEQALLDSKIDLAVHSYKDMPCDQVQELPIVALSKRESPFDALVLPENMCTLDKSKAVGSSSLRRSIQFKAIYYGLELRIIRGNVLTRLDKLDKGEYSAVILAHAGLIRLNLQGRISKVFTADEILPSASQGILAVQGRAGEDYSYLEDFHSKESEYVSMAERQFLTTLDGGCSSPIAAYARLDGREIKLTGMYVDDMGRMFKDSICGDLHNSRWLGEKLALSLKEKAVKGW